MSWKVVEINYKDEIFEVNTNIETIAVGTKFIINGVNYFVTSLGIDREGYKDIKVETEDERNYGDMANVFTKWMDNILHDSEWNFDKFDKYQIEDLDYELQKRGYKLNKIDNK